VKALFVYKYLTLGGVETVLRTRLVGLRDRGIDAHAWFFHDLGGRSVFHGLEDRVRVGDPDSCGRAIALEGFDVVSTIDTEEVLPFLPGLDDSAGDQPVLIIECHSAYPESLGYLSDIRSFHPWAIFVPSEHQERTVREKIGNGFDVRVVPNPLAAELVAETGPFPAPPPRPVVAWIGRLDGLKNWSGFLDLLETLERRGIDFEGWLVGRPAESVGQELCARARERGVLGRIRWFRGIPHARIPTFLDAVRDSGGVLVVTSRGESFGMTVAEAMARACPVVVPAHPPFSEFVTHGETGLLVCRDSPEAAAGAVGDLLGDPALRARIGARARTAILGKFSPEVAMDILAGELRRLVDFRTGSGTIAPAADP
jgi:L-malate glycosyltransferase